MRLPGQTSRLALLGAYVLAFCGVSVYAQGTLVPPLGAQGLWFYSGLAALLLGNLISTPHYSKPADSLAYGVAAALALLATTGATGRLSQDLRIGGIAYVLLVVVLSALAIAWKDSARPSLQKLADSGSKIVRVFGTPTFVFVPVYAFALVAFHSGTAREFLPIALAGLFIIALRPLESLVAVVRDVAATWLGTEGRIRAVGEVIGHQTPHLVVFRVLPGESVDAGDAILCKSELGETVFALVLDNLGWSGGAWQRALTLDAPVTAVRGILKALRLAPDDVSPGTVLALLDAEELLGGLINDPTWTRRAELIGVVAPGTDISSLMLELAATDVELRQGQLLQAYVQGVPVMYQIFNAITREEVLERHSLHGFVRVEARRVGHWDESAEVFKHVHWIPEPNAPVFAHATSDATFDISAIGHFPGTDYKARVDLPQLVAHNTAVLGILGVGKSCLSLEIVERLLTTRIKVVCLDPTGEYEAALGEYSDAGVTRVKEELKAIGQSGRLNFSKVREEGGSVGQFKTAIKDKLLSPLLDPGQESWCLAVLNPSEFEVWRQVGTLFRDNEVLPMAQLTPPEITQIICEGCLELLQERGVAAVPGTARCCIVLEEAHTLVPEWNAAVAEGDKSAANGSARAIIQGRKYGLGCLLVTQRTANVTKTILNQCNTMFAMRSYDATGAEFLSNYIGQDYVGVLNGLEDRHAILFGKASSCKDPVLLELNDRSDFIATHRAANPIVPSAVLLDPGVTEEAS